MSKIIPATERIEKARALIQKARELPVPEDMGWANFTYVANVRDLMRQAKDLIKLIPYSPSASAEMKAKVKAIFAEAEQAEKEILHRE